MVLKLLPSPSMKVRSAPAPVSRRFSGTISCPPCATRLYVPAGRTIVSCTALPLRSAAISAPRSEHVVAQVAAALSAVVLTLNVSAAAGAGATSPPSTATTPMRRRVIGAASRGSARRHAP